MKKAPKERSGKAIRSITRGPNANATPRSRRWLVYIGMFGAALAGSFFVVWTFVLPRVPTEITGQWFVEGGPMGNAELEIQRNGSFSARVPGAEQLVEGRIVARENSLLFITVNPYTNKEEAKQQWIKQLSNLEMTLEDPQGKGMRLVRRK